VTVRLDSRLLTADEIQTLAVRDGFADNGDFAAFSEDTYGPKFQGELIEWNP